MKLPFTLICLCIPVLLFSQKDHSPTPLDESEKTQGYLNFTSFGQYFGSNGDEKTIISSVQMEHNYRLNKHLAMGLVTGVDWLDIIMAPIGANIKWLLTQNDDKSFFAGGSLGHSIPLEKMNPGQFEVIDTKGGPFVNTELGYIFPCYRGIKLYMAMGYHHQSFSFIREDWWATEVTRKISYNRFSLRIGVKLF